MLRGLRKGPRFFCPILPQGAIFLYFCNLRQKSVTSYRFVGVGVLAALLVTGCGYRAPFHASYIPEISDSTRYAGVRTDYQPLAALVAKDTGMEPITGNTVGLVNDQHQKFDLLLDDISKVKESLYIDHYRFCYDSCGSRLSDMMIDKAAAGKDVRIIVDYGAHTRAQRKGHQALLDSKVDFRYFHFPVMLIDYVLPAQATHRDHRKLVLLDGKTAYLGGRNIQDRYFVDWRDADIRITGPVVNDLAAIFNENQYRVAPENAPVPTKPERELREAAAHDTVPGLTLFYDTTVQVFSDSPVDRRLPIRNCFEWAIDHAQRYFWFYNPYTPPPASTLKALKSAAARGVDVRWIVPGNNDVKLAQSLGESLYKELLQAGIRIYEWQEHVLHVKQFMVDDYLTGIGSANMDNLSFFLNYEMQALIYDEAFTRHATDIYRRELETDCVEIKLEEVLSWSFFRKLRNWIVRTLGGPLG